MKALPKGVVRYMTDKRSMPYGSFEAARVSNNSDRNEELFLFTADIWNERAIE